MLALGNGQLSGAYLGDKPVVAAYLGEQPLWGGLRYAAMEALVGDGAACIDTGFYPNTNSRIEIAFAYSAQDVANKQRSPARFFTLERDSGGVGAFGVYINGSGGISVASTWRGDNTFVVTGLTAEANKRYTAAYDTQQRLLYVNGVAYALVNVNEDLPSDNPVVLFSISYVNAGNKMSGKIYAADFYEDGVPVRRFVPARLLAPTSRTSDGRRHPAGECGMVETISNVFYGNANTSGTFTAE